MKKTINWTIIAIVIIAVIGGLCAISMLKASNDKTVNAQGVSEMDVKPDLAVVNILIETNKDTAEAAKNKNSEITDLVLRVLRNSGLDLEISTENYNIYPEYDWVENGRKLKGYKAENYIKVETKDFEEVGKIVDGAVDSGALISYINFELSAGKMSDYKTEVLSKASEDARKKANAVAQGLGKKLGDVISVSTSDYRYMPFNYYAKGMDIAVAEAVSSVPTQIESQKLTVSATVDVVYELK